MSQQEMKKIIPKLLEATLREDSCIVSKCEYPNQEFNGGYVAKMFNVKVYIQKNDKEEILELLAKVSVEDPKNIFTEAYSNEIDVYKTIVPYFNQFAKERGIEKIESIPKCYGTWEENNQFLLLLENLLPKDFKVRELSPLDMDHLKILLEALAEWHAFSFALNDQNPEVFKKFGKRNTILDQWKICELTATSFEEQMDFHIQLYESKEKTGDVLIKLKSLRKNYRKFLEEFLLNKNEEYLVVTHSDLWNNNFLFKYNEEARPTEVKIVDWQTAIVGSPLIDIAQILFFCCSIEELKQIDDLFLIYYNALSNRIRMLGSDPTKCFPLEACKKSLKRYAKLAIAGVPFLVRMLFNTMDPDTSPDTSEGNFGSILGNVSDFDKYFETVNTILEFCISHDFI